MIEAAGRAAVLLAALLCGNAGAAGEAEALVSRHAEMAGELASGPFGRPMRLDAAESDSAPSGQVFAIVEHPFKTVSEALAQPQTWCALMMLQTNVKRCKVTEKGAERRLDVAVARRYTDSVDDAQPVSFRYRARLAGADYLSIELGADEGPVGTHDYTLRFEAVPIAAGRSFVHLSYDYRTGYAARLATRLYLTTAGRDKVGFSIVEQDDAGKPVRVRGIQGVVERNVMRYFLAIDSTLDSLSAPPSQRLEQRLRHFHAALERYPDQLHETRLDEYLAMKRRELGGTAD